MKDRGPWLHTYTGRLFFPMDPRAEDIDILDMAHALSNICRFGGHCQGHYSVAEHSIHVATLLGDRKPSVRMAGLLHDAAEAYLCDLTSPIKYGCPGIKKEYSLIEEMVERVIFDKYDLLYPMDADIKIADKVALASEVESVLKPLDMKFTARDGEVQLTRHIWGIEYEPSQALINLLDKGTLDAREAETSFLYTWSILSHLRKGEP